MAWEDEASPRRRVGVGFVAACLFAYLGMWMALLTLSASIVRVLVQVASALDIGPASEAKFVSMTPYPTP